MNAETLKKECTLSQLYEYQTKIPQYQVTNGVTSEIVRDAIKLKERAIFKASWFVTMNDKFMSGWGHATNKTNKLIIACETLQQARVVERNALKRPEMKYVNICNTKPQIKSHIYPSWKHIEDMGEIWTKE